MLTYQLFFISVFSLVPAPGSLVAGQASTKCSTDQAAPKINGQDCTEALKQVIYQTSNPPNQPGVPPVIEAIETHIERVSGSCVVVFDRSTSGPVGGKPAVITQSMFENAIKSLVNQCKGLAGSVNSLEDKKVTFKIQPPRTNPSTKIFDDNFPPLQVSCSGIRQGLPDQECLKAFNALPVDKDDKLISSSTGKATDKALQTFNNCQAKIVSTDGSVITDTKASILQLFTSVVNTCKGQPGIVAKAKGVAGRNGRLLIQTTPPPRKN